ncbi:hypothetical protein [Streptococcus equinus]|uniref:hypothetical protein n=1 Tax=Streptococcus equinus TaxID=1335 RepID=UPI00215AC483|nr:hypothetical protein [Streptococcus equinus]UVF02714.1 hypothetical protein KRG72_08965 [Streptococcus equinus]
MMENIFKNTADMLEKYSIQTIKDYKELSNLSLHELLYNPVYEDLARFDKSIQPYYGRSKDTAKQALSRVLNGKAKLTDEMVSILSKNMSMTINDLAWGLSETLRERQVNYAQHLFLDYVENSRMESLFFSIFQDAFLSEKYGELVTEMLEGYVPFAIRSSYTRYVNGDGFDKRRAFSNPSFRREFWRACEWLYSKLNFIYREKTETSWMSTRYRSFIKKNNSVKNRARIIEKFFNFIAEDEKMYPSEFNYGKQVKALIDDKVVTAILEYNGFYHGMLLFEKNVNKYWKIKNQELKDTLKYIRTLEKRQKEMSKIGCYI